MQISFSGVGLGGLGGGEAVPARGTGIKNIFIVIKRTFFYYYYFASLSGTNDANYSNVSARYFLFSAPMSFVYLSCVAPSLSRIARILFIDRDKRHEANFKR